MVPASLIAWEAAIALAFLGFGRAILRSARLPAAPAAVAGCLGAAAFLAGGGWLNLADLLHARVLLALILAGAVYAAIDMGARSRTNIPALLRSFRTSPTAMLALCAAIAIPCILVATSIRPVPFNYWDDLQAYMGYCVKALQHGSLQSDPFSERRINTGLGGQILLNLLMLSYGGVRSIDFIDSGIGLAFLAMALYTLARTLGLARLRAAILLCCIPVIPLFKVNLTTVYFSSAWFLAAALMFVHPSLGPGLNRRKSLLIGLLAGAACTTKSSNLCFFVPFLFLTALLYAWLARDKHCVLSAAGMVAMVPVIALPWSIAQRRNQGTYLFPLLGKGFHAGAYHHLPIPSGSGALYGAVIAAAPNVLALAVSGVCVWKLTRTWSSMARSALAGFFSAAVLATCAMAISTAGEAVDRFTMPFYSMCAFLLVLVLLHPHEFTARWWRRAGWATAVLWIGAIANFVGIHGHQYEMTRAEVAGLFLHDPAAAYPEWVATPSNATFALELARAQHAQASLPDGETAIETLVYCYPYDFMRNTIYIADYPGMAGLPPGLPVSGSPEEIRSYLVAHSIHYLLYDRRLEVHRQIETFSAAVPSAQTRLWLVHAIFRRLRESRALAPWSLVEFSTSVLVRQKLEALTHTHHVVYDDGTVVVVQLND